MKFWLMTAIFATLSLCLAHLLLTYGDERQVVFGIIIFTITGGTLGALLTKETTNVRHPD